MLEKAAIAKRLKEYRKQNHLSQMEFAEACGVSVETLSLLEREKYNPTLETLQSLAVGMGLSVTALVEVKKK